MLSITNLTASGVLVLAQTLAAPTVPNPTSRALTFIATNAGNNNGNNNVGNNNGNGNTGNNNGNGNIGNLNGNGNAGSNNGNNNTGSGFGNNTAASGVGNGNVAAVRPGLAQAPQHGTVGLRHRGH